MIRWRLLPSKIMLVESFHLLEYRLLRLIIQSQSLRLSHRYIWRIYECHGLLDGNPTLTKFLHLVKLLIVVNILIISWCFLLHHVPLILSWWIHVLRQPLSHFHLVFVHSRASMYYWFIIMLLCFTQLFECQVIWVLIPFQIILHRLMLPWSLVEWSLLPTNVQLWYWMFFTLGLSGERNWCKGYSTLIFDLHHWTNFVIHEERLLILDVYLLLWLTTSESVTSLMFSARQFGKHASCAAVVLFPYGFLCFVIRSAFLILAKGILILLVSLVLTLWMLFWQIWVFFTIFQRATSILEVLILLHHWTQLRVVILELWVEIAIWFVFSRLLMYDVLTWLDELLLYLVWINLTLGYQALLTALPL